MRRPPPKHRKPAIRHRWSFLLEVTCIFVIATVVSLLVKTLLVQAFFIPSESMEPVLHGCERCANNDRVLVNKLTTRMGGVHRGDIVVFRDSDGWLQGAHSFRDAREAESCSRGPCLPWLRPLEQ